MSALGDERTRKTVTMQRLRTMEEVSEIALYWEATEVDKPYEPSFTSDGRVNERVQVQAVLALADTWGNESSLNDKNLLEQEKAAKVVAEKAYADCKSEAEKTKAALAQLQAQVQVQVQVQAQVQA